MVLLFCVVASFCVCLVWCGVGVRVWCLCLCLKVWCVVWFMCCLWWVCCCECCCCVLRLCVGCAMRCVLMFVFGVSRLCLLCVGEFSMFSVCDDVSSLACGV